MNCMFMFVCLSLLKIRKCVAGKFEPFVVGGSYTTIKKFPHAVFISIIGKEGSWRCGGTVLNQKILLTAAHCFEGTSNASKILALVGNENKNEGTEFVVEKYHCHEKYDPEQAVNDVCVNALKDMLQLSDKVKRVSIMRFPPYNEQAEMAGWGLVDEVNHIKTDKLKYVAQKVHDKKTCQKILGEMNRGTLCAGLEGTNQYASEGDSGGALLVRGYIQIGIVSYKIMDITETVIYTDVGYYFDWIQKHSARLFCIGKQKNVEV